MRKKERNRTNRSVAGTIRRTPRPKDILQQNRARDEEVRGDYDELR